MTKQTEMIDRLFLELSQFTSAKTERELVLEHIVRGLLIDMRAFDKSGTFSKLRSYSNAEAILAETNAGVHPTP